MISVQNHLRLSNGNKLVLLLLLAFSLSSCSVLFPDRTHSKPRTYKKKKPVKSTTDPVKVDTINWEDEGVVNIPDLPQKDKYEKYGSEFKDIYKICLILPLESNKYFEDLGELRSDVSYRFINYYAGVQLALEDISKENVNIELEVMNSSLRSNDARKISNELNRLNPDLIIGPYERDLLKEMARYAKRKDITLISPWQSSSRITQDNPNYIQLKPDIKTFYKRIVEHLDQKFIPGQVYLVARDQNKTENNRIHYLQGIHMDNGKGSFSSDPYNVFYVEEDSLSLGVTAFDSLFVDQLYRDIAVVIPNWSYKDEGFIYSCLRKLNAEKQMTNVSVYGMPIILDSDKIGFNLYKSLNLKVAMDGYIDKTERKVQNFRERYHKNFHSIPTQSAYEGYDMMYYVAANLIRHGTKFQYFIQDEHQEFLQSSFKMVPRMLSENVIAEELESADYFENANIDIWEFDYNAFVKSK